MSSHVASGYCRYVIEYSINYINMFTLLFFSLVYAFQLRRLLHEHRIFAPKSDSGLDMGVHYYPRHPIYTMRAVSRFGYKMQGSFVYWFNNFVVEGV